MSVGRWCSVGILSGAAVVAIVGLSAVPSSATPTCTKTAKNNGASWTTASRWTPAGVPATTDYVCIPVGTVTIDNASTISVAGFSVQGGTLNVNGVLSATNAAPAGFSELMSGTLGGSGSGSVTVAGKLSWTGGNMTGSGTTTIPSGATLAMTPTAQLYLGGTRTLTNSGSATLTLVANGNTLDFYDSTQGCAPQSPVFVNAGSLTIAGPNANDPGIADNCGSGLIHNTGSITKSGNGTDVVNLALDNDGSVQASAGTVRLAGGGGNAATATGHFATTGAGTVEFANGIYGLDTGATLGRVTLSGAEVDVATGVTAHVVGPMAFSAGVVGGDGTLAVDAGQTFTWSGGTMNGAGATTIASTATLTMTPVAQIYLGATRTLTNSGTATLTTVANGNTLDFYDSTQGCAPQSPVFVNAGSLTIAGPNANDPDIMDSCGAGSIHNTTTGTISKSSGTGTTHVRPPLDNDGSVQASAGTLSFAGGGGNAATATGHFATTGAGTVEFANGIYGLDTGATLGRVTLSGAEVDVATGATVHVVGPMAFSAGVVGGDGTLAVDAGQTFTWSGGTMNGAGATTIASTATLTMTPVAQIYLGATRTLTNSGTATLTTVANGNTLDFYDSTQGCAPQSPVFVNAGSLTIAGPNANDPDIMDSCGAGSIHNTTTGTISKSSGAGTTHVRPPLDNDGSVQASAGMLSFDGGGGAGEMATGSFGATGSSPVVFGGGTFVLDTGATLGLATIAAEVDVATGATVHVVGPTTLAAGAIAGDGTLAVDAGKTFTWTGGAMAGTGATTIAPTATLTMTPANQIYLGAPRTLTNLGTATLTTVANGPTLDFYDPQQGCTPQTAVFVNAGPLALAGPGANDPGIIDSCGAGLIHNTSTGAITKVSGTGTTSVTVAVDNDGTVQASAGTLLFNGGFPAIVGNALTKGTYIASSAKLQIQGLDLTQSSATITLDGPTAKFTDASNTNGLRDLTSNTATGTITLKNGATVSTKPLTNSGAIVVGPGTNSGLTVPTLFTQTGGSTALSDPTSKLTVSGAAGKAAINGGTLSGIGTVVAPGSPGLGSSSAGTLSPGNAGLGTLNVTGSANASGNLAIELNGTAAGQYDVLAVSGNAAVGGTLSLTTNFTPVLGDSFTIVTGASHAGAFTTVNGADLPGDLSYGIDYSIPTKIIVRVVRPVVTVDDVSVNEGDGPAATAATVTFHLDGSSAAPITIEWATAGNGSAVAGSDYTAVGASDHRTVTFAPFTTVKTDAVSIVGDIVVERPVDETLLVNVTAETNANIDPNNVPPADPQATVTIHDDDKYRLTIADNPTISEGDTGTTNATFHVSISQPSPDPIAITYSTGAGTAIESPAAHADYEGAQNAGATILAADANGVDLTVAIDGDVVDELDETFTVTIASTDATVRLDDAAAVGTIVDDDTVSIDPNGFPDGTVIEGGNGSLTVTLGHPSQSAIAIPFSTVAGANTLATDYSPTSGSFSFPAYATSATQVFTANHDGVVKSRSFTVNLTPPSAVVGQDTTATAAITEIDGSGANLRASVSGPASSVLPAQDAAYATTVSNLGPAAATRVKLTDTLPTNVTVLPLPSGCRLAGSVVTCTVPGTLAAGASAHYTITIRARVTGAMNDAVSVAGLQTDPTPANNTANAATTVRAPANGQITYQKAENGTSGPTDLWSMTTSGTSEHALSIDVAGRSDSNPSWSPDGRYLAYSSDRLALNNFDIFIWDSHSPIGAGNPRRLTSSGADDHQPTWSPDGTQIAFDRSDGSINVVNTIGTPVEQAIASGGAPEWSPWLGAAKNTSKIAYQRLASGQMEIYTIKLNGTGETLLNTTDHAINEDFGPSWSPDGTKIVFNRRLSSGTNNDVYRVPIAGGAPTRLTTVNADDGFASYSPDGALIAFATARDAGQSYNIYRMTQSGTQETRLTNAPQIETKSDWQAV